MTIKNIAIGLLCLILPFLSIFVGSEPSAESSHFVFYYLRLPRMMMAFFVGSLMGLTGAVYQSIFHNPLATPSTIGTTAGAALGALMAFVLFDNSYVFGLPLVIVMSFLGAVLVTFVITLLASHARARINDILLAGIGVSLAAGAVSSGIQFSADMTSTFEGIRWSLGNLATVGYSRVTVLLPFFIVVSAVLLSQVRALESLASGEERAHTQGVPVKKVRTLCLFAGSLGVGICVALCGPIAFIGLIVPHFVRLAIGANCRLLVPYSLLVGGVFLTLCDTFARTLLDNRDLPVGVVTAAIGAPLIIWLIYRQQRMA